MKKRSAKKGIKFRRLFNKIGMTYVELICALALLSLVVVMFTPMLLSSYEQLYAAGEKVEEVYDSKVEIEGGLASRSSISIANIGMTFKMNSEKLFENMNIAGRRITSHFQSELETVFHGARARVDLLTPDVVYDDTSWHDIVLQTTGIDWESGEVILRNLKEYRDLSYDDLIGKITEGKAKIIIDVVRPNKQTGSAGTSTDPLVYDNGHRVEIIKNDAQELLSVDSVKKRISFRFSGADFTFSPLKICVYYVNERGVLKTLSDYLYIKPAHIIFAGKGTADYFTSAGIEQVDMSTGNAENSEHKTQYQFSIEGRAMQLTNSKLLSNGPQSSGVTINTIQWISNDAQKGFDPYYVMAGSNGSVYRMYNMNTEAGLKDLLGTQNDVDPTYDNRYNIDTGETIFPSFWSGEISDQYYFRTEDNAAGYGDAPDNTIDCSRETLYNTFDTKFRYMMVFSGGRTGYNYRSQASRRMSYVLTEAGAYSFRFAGKKSDENDFKGYTAVWEPRTECYVGKGETHTPSLRQEWDVYDGILEKRNQRITAGTVDNPYPKPIYFTNYSGKLFFDSSENEHFETNLAFISAFSYTSIPVHDLAFNSDQNCLFNRFYGVGENSGEKGGFFWGNKGEDGQMQGNGGTIEKDLVWPYSTNINIESAVYLPGSSSSGEGQVIYLGTVPAYTLVRQSSDIGKNDRYMYNGKNIHNSRCTLFYIMSNGADGAYVAKLASKDINFIGPTSDNFKWQLWNIFHQDVMNRSDVISEQGGSSRGMVAGLGSAAEVYTRGNVDEQSVFYHDPDLQFTFGYCSRWRMAQGSVTSNGTTEATKSYESFYTDSHYTAKGLDYLDYYDRVPSAGINNGSVDNMYYNVWFPGEHYTLTKTATLDEVTVAVGYAVSGSSFMEQSSAASSGFMGTALGSVYNDGVLAAYTSADKYSYELDASEGGKTNIFDNLLYYKSPTFTNAWTHSRENVRFTTVGLSAETSEQNSSNKGTKQYYAYYGDSNGKVYRSLVATANVTFQAVPGKDEDDIITESVELVGAIPDTKRETPITSTANNGVQEIKLTGQYDGTPIDKLFEEITAIECYDDLIIISGKPQSNIEYNAFKNPFNGFVVGVRDSSGNWEWKVHAMQASQAPGGLLQSSTLDCARIIGNYLYMSGYGNIRSNGDECWVAGINLDVFRNLPNGQVVPFAGYDNSPTDNMGMWQNLGAENRIYAIDGYATN